MTFDKTAMSATNKIVHNFTEQTPAGDKADLAATDVAVHKAYLDLVAAR